MRSILTPTEAAQASIAPQALRSVRASGDFEVLSRLDRKRQPLTTEVCRRCGLVSHQQIPTEAELAEFYGTAVPLGVSRRDHAEPAARDAGLAEWTADLPAGRSVADRSGRACWRSARASAAP